ncbi:EamA family transporter RarD [Endozoicomonas montiporae]|uniref:RarD protein n=1 Tax=Endozoicomonas montiporae CL-33 TaxID=570277 RepID=A0A142BFC3_9GAMM|nr:EamA family transporter RarD [Endozoicomonas montiporae]AMO57449.1 RarD protein [Endozoicomonas montiporae CL-33]
MSDQKDYSGFNVALMAFSFWGLIPLYFKLLSHVPPTEVLGHRVLWSVVLLFGLMLIKRQLPQFLAILKSPATMAWLSLSAVLVAANWLGFIWGVSNNRVLQTSLGYFINPLLSVLLGFVFLGERLNKTQLLAVALAAIAVIIQTIMLGEVPWLSLGIAGSFGLYGLIRKRTVVSALPGLAFETLFLLPIALIYFTTLYQSGDYHFRMDDPATSVLLALAGFVTTFPLICFNMAAKKLPLSTLGLMQYIVPTMSFLFGVFLFKEPFTQAQLICFGIIWIALIIFSTDSLRQHRKTERQLADSSSDSVNTTKEKTVNS